MGLDTTAFQRGLAKSQKMASQAAGAIGTAMVGSFAAIATAAINTGSRISDLATQLNIGNEEIQTLQYLAREAGASNSALERSLRNVQTRTEEAINGNKSYSEAFQRLNINIHEFRRLSTEKKLEAIANAQANATDKAQAYNDVARILGERAGPELQEVLQSLATKGFDKVAESARNAGKIIKDETISQLDAAADAIEEAKNNVTVSSAAILGGIADVAGGVAMAYESVRQGRNMWAEYAIAEFYAEEAARELAESQAKLDEEATKASKKQEEYNRRLEDYQKWQIASAEAVKIREKAEADLSAELNENINQYILASELESIQMRAKGEAEAADALDEKNRKMREATEIAKKYGISVKEAAQIVQNLSEQEKKATDDASGKSSENGESMGEESDPRRPDKRIRFQKFVGPNGESYNQRFYNGKKAGRFSDEQLELAAKGVTGKNGKGDELNTHIQKQTTVLESIEREIRRNPS